MTRRPLLRAMLAQPLTMADAEAAGFILPAGRRVEGLPVYATSALVEELQAAGGEDWQAATERMALGAWAAAVMAIHNGAGPRPRRWRARYRVDDGQRVPFAVTMKRPGAIEARGAILAMLDGE